jgi:AcrR family transcriptional regulator
MARKYTLKRRAEQQAGTRARIVEAAMALHGSVGPARTTFSMVARRAGVQRHTLYAHFPDERSLLLACSEHHLETDPLPDPAAWKDIPDRQERLRTALGEIFAWYERNAEIAGSVLRDAEHHAVLREVAQLRFGPHFAAYSSALGAGDGPRVQAAMLGLALSFNTWRTLVRDGGLTSIAAAEAMVAGIGAAAARDGDDAGGADERARAAGVQGGAGEHPYAEARTEGRQ